MFHDQIGNLLDEVIKIQMNREILDYSILEMVIKMIFFNIYKVIFQSINSHILPTLFKILIESMKIFGN